MLSRVAKRGFIRFQSTAAIPEHYAIPEIASLSKFKENGIPGLLSAKGLDNAYYSRVGNHVNQLNEELTKLSMNGNAALDVLVQESATNPRTLRVFNNASLIQNISFAMATVGEVREENPNKGIFKPDSKAFLKTPDLSLDVPNPPALGKALDTKLKQDFGSLIELKTLLIQSANAINGDGFTWLVARDNSYFKEEKNTALKTASQLYIVNTYNSGSPTNFDRVGQLDDLRHKYNRKNNIEEPLSESTSAIPDFDEVEFSRFQNIKYFPLLAIDASPKVWLHDYGVFGKRQYLEQAWKSIDWDIVEKRLPEIIVNVLGN